MASEMVVDTQKLYNYGSRIDLVNRNIKSIDKRIDDLYFTVRLDGLLQAVTLTNQASKLSACSKYLTETSEEIERADNNVCQKTPTNFVDDLSLSDFKDVFKVIGKVGSIGAVVSGVGNIASVLSDYKFLTSKEYADSAVGLAKAVHSTAKGIKKLGESFGKVKKMIGLDDHFKGNASRFRADWLKNPGFFESLKDVKTGAGWSKRFGRNFNKSMKSGIGNVSKSTVIFTAIGNAIDNYDEMKEEGISLERAIAETFVESVVDIGKDIAIGSAVAAGVAATFGSAPVLLVGAATVGITMGLDWASEQLTGKDLTENVSDIICNVGEAAVKVGDKLVGGMTDMIRSAGNFFGKVFA